MIETETEKVFTQKKGRKENELIQDQWGLLESYSVSLQVLDRQVWEASGIET